MQTSGSVVVLCGGRGTRLQEHTHSIPKALVEIGGKPILWHVLRIYAAQGLRRFVLCTGYLGEMIERFVAAEPWPESVDIECVDTGLDTPTGGRIKLVEDRVEGAFHATYADGVANVELGALSEFHDAHGDLATVTVVRPRSQFGIAELDGEGRVRGFAEKPQLDHWVNGGFFVFEPGVFEYLQVDSVLEREPLERLASDGRLHAYRHDGFWDCMDTYKDAVLLNDLWATDDPPWCVWEGQEGAEHWGEADAGTATRYSPRSRASPGARRTKS